MTTIPIYNCLIEELDDTTGVFAMSFVDSPANEVDFVALQQNRQAQQLNRNPQKQILTGVVLQPEQLIYRHTPAQGEHYIKFSTQQIERISHKMMRTGVALHNTTHQHQSPLKGNYLVELWIVEDPETDKSKLLGFSDLPQGTLMCSYKIEDANYWQNEVMSGNVKGFSIEGFFNQQIEMKHKSVKQNVKMNDKSKKKNLLTRLANLLLDIETVQKTDATTSGEAFVIFTLADGKEVYVDQDGYATLDDEQMPAGEHPLADNNLLLIDQNGQFVETKPAAEANKTTEEKTAPQTLTKKNKREALAQFEPKTAQALKAKIAEMQTTIDELAQALTDAQDILENTKNEVEEMKKITPTSQPLKQKISFADGQDLTTAQRMAVALNQTISRK